MAAQTIADTIPVAELLAMVRKAARGQSWCDAAESMLEERLDLEFRVSGPRFTPLARCPKELERAKVVELIKHARREQPHRTRPLVAEVIKKWGLTEAEPAFRITVTMTLDAEEVEAQGSGWKIGKDGKPTDPTDPDLLTAAAYAFGELWDADDRMTVSVAR